MTIYQPYTYLIGWSKLNRWYYGVRFAKNCNPTDLWVTYFTSSKHVKAFRIEHGEPDVIEIRRVFTNAEQAGNWERKVLLRINAAYAEKWINKSAAKIMGPKFKRNTLPGSRAGTLKTKGKTLEEIHGKEKAQIIRSRLCIAQQISWKSKERKPHATNPNKDTSKYKEAARRRWADKDARKVWLSGVRQANSTRVYNIVKDATGKFTK